MKPPTLREDGSPAFPQTVAGLAARPAFHAQIIADEAWLIADAVLAQLDKTARDER